MNSKIQRFKDTSNNPGPFDQKYVPIIFKTDKVTGAVTLTIEGTGTVVIGCNLNEACVRLLLVYKLDKDKALAIGKTLHQSYGF